MACHLLNVVLPEAGSHRFGAPDDQILALIHALDDDETICRILARLDEATSWLDLLTPPED